MIHKGGRHGLVASYDHVIGVSIDGNTLNVSRPLKTSESGSILRIMSWMLGCLDVRYAHIAARDASTAAEDVQGSCAAWVRTCVTPSGTASDLPLFRVHTAAQYDPMRPCASTSEWPQPQFTPSSLLPTNPGHSSRTRYSSSLHQPQILSASYSTARTGPSTSQASFAPIPARRGSSARSCAPSSCLFHVQF